MFGVLLAVFAGTVQEFSPGATTMFPFVIPWDDAVAKTATDVSFLNGTPAGQNGRIITKYGHFVEETSGRRVRFFGVNFGGKCAFPSHADADKVAAHLAKMGVNIVRFHHLQNNWETDGGFIWKPGKIWLEVDPAQLDKMDYLVSALKKRGIYSNLNLQTSRNYLPEMGFSDSVLKLTDFSKRVDKFDRRMIELQKEYAKDLLDRTNKYTGLAYKNDPAVAVVEINNENSLVGAPWEGFAAGLTGLPEPFRGELVGLWNAWLTKRYGKDEALASAWQAGLPHASGLSQLTPQNQWTYETQGASVATFQNIPSEGTSPKLEVNVTRVDGVTWHIQAHLAGLTLKGGTDYTVSFRARSDSNRKVLVYSSLDIADWRNTGLSSSVDLSPEWKQYSLSFTAGAATDGHNRIAFMLGDQPGKVFIESTRLVEGFEGGGLKPTESLTLKNIDLGPEGSRVQREDYVRFLADTERAYGDEMRSYLTKTLGFKCNIIDTQVAWGGLTSLTREAESSFADNHAYYAHPSFPRVPWSDTDWLIDNTPMVKNMDTSYGELGGLALARVEGKPYSISEYNHPAPNDYQAECLPLLATFAAQQDWDMIYLFAYSRYGTGEANERIQSYFDIGSNPAKKAFFPAAALVFRNQLVLSSPSKATLELPKDPWKISPTAAGAWAGMGELPNLYETRVAISASDVKKPQLLRSGFVIDLQSSTKAERRTSGVVYQTDSPGAKVLVGFLGGETIGLKDFTATFPKFGNEFGTMMLTSTDGLPLAKSERVLLTLVGKVENQGMQWNDAHNSVNNHWGTAPTVAEGIAAIISLKTTGPRVVFALDGNGNRRTRVPSRYQNGQTTFITGDKFKTLWYEIAQPAEKISASFNTLPSGQLRLLREGSNFL